MVVAVISPPPLPSAILDAASAPDPRAAVTAALRESFNADRARAARRAESATDGAEAARLYAEAADALLSTLWRFATEQVHPAPEERLTLLAGGGYGRGVLAPFSYLDLLFLRPSQALSATAQP